jgi:3-deoxy-alpha-D-manno-octulosonate 8-oxidase
LQDYYPSDVALFKQMKQAHDIELPQGICRDLTDSQMNTMVKIALSLVPLWENALGPDWESIINAEKLKALYTKM